MRERDLNARINNRNDSETFLKQKEAQLREKKLQEGKERVNNNNKNEQKEPKISVEVKPIAKKTDLTDALSSRLSGALSNIEQFHFPLGKPNRTTNELIIQRAQQVFNKLDNGKAYKNNMATIMKVSVSPSTIHSIIYYFFMLRYTCFVQACDLPSFWKQLIFRSGGGEKVGYLTFTTFQSTLKR